MRLLHIDSSVLGDNSVTRSLTRAVTEEWQRAYPDIVVSYRDLATHAPSHLSADVLAAGAVAPAQRSPRQQQEAEVSEALLEEFLAADVLVIGAPMYNFSIPSQLKAWLDRVLVKGRTFRYTAAGPVGLAGGKRAVIVSSRGGVYSQGTAQAMDHQESYLRTALGFAGITDITVIRAEGVNMSDRREQAIAAAHGRIRVLVREAA